MYELRYSILLVALSAAVAACAPSPDKHDPAPTISKANEIGLPAASLKYLKIEAVGAGTGSQSGVLPGRIAFRQQATSSVQSLVPARVMSLQVRLGQTVKAGDVLMTLQSADAAGARAALETATVRAAAAEDLLRRQDEMLKRGVGQEVERYTADSAAREARAELARARHAAAQLGVGQGDTLSLRAPAAGVVLAVRTSVGAMVGQGGDPLVDIGDPTRLWVVADVPEGDIARVAAGGAATIRVPASDLQVDAVVDGMGQTLDDQRRLAVYLNPKTPLPRLAPGMYAEVRLSQPATSGALSLPVGAVLIKGAGKRLVYVQHEDGHFEQRPVRTGASRDGRVPILEGLAAGDKVVVQGALLLDSEAELLL